MNRTFCIQDLNVEVTSLDIATDGSLVVVGCSNGIILLFDPTNDSLQHGGRIIGHIRAKGLHTNLLMTAKITDDCKYCFAGVMKGSSEMIAIDLNISKILENEHAQTYSHSDPKLRGFGATARLVQENCGQITYRLACGRGIKNVHVWQFSPPPVMGGSPCWVCIYDVASNGNTITTVGFRNCGLELLSKSAGMNIRVWDISRNGYEVTNSGFKPSYEDISNSQDAKCLIDCNFAFGGTYEFATIKIDGHKEANRDVFEMPERIVTGPAEVDLYSAGLRRRRF